MSRVPAKWIDFTSKDMETKMTGIALFDCVLDMKRELDASLSLQKELDREIQELRDQLEDVRGFLLI